MILITSLGCAWVTFKKEGGVMTPLSLGWGLVGGGILLFALTIASAFCFVVFRAKLRFGIVGAFVALRRAGEVGQKGNRVVTILVKTAVVLTIYVVSPLLVIAGIIVLIAA